MLVRLLPTLGERIALIQLAGPLGAWESARLNEWSKLDWGSPKIISAVDHIGERLYGDAWATFIRGVPLVGQSH